MTDNLLILTIRNYNMLMPRYDHRVLKLNMLKKEENPSLFWM